MKLSTVRLRIHSGKLFYIFLCPEKKNVCMLERGELQSEKNPAILHEFSFFFFDSSDKKNDSFSQSKRGRGETPVFVLGLSLYQLLLQEHNNVLTNPTPAPHSFFTYTHRHIRGGTLCVRYHPKIFLSSFKQKEKKTKMAFCLAFLRTHPYPSWCKVICQHN